MRKKLQGENRKSAEKEFTSCRDKKIWKIAEKKVYSFQKSIDMFYNLYACWTNDLQFTKQKFYSKYYTFRF